MATLVLGAAGAAIGGSFGGSLLGLSGAVLGRAAGATLGRVIDQSILGQGGDAVEHGRLDQFRITGASEGAPLSRAVGRVRVGGQVIWATRFKEHRTTGGGGGGGKGKPKAPTATTYSYTSSFAMALCEGVIRRVGRVWADGREIARDTLDMRVYHGTEDQPPDALVEAIDGADRANAFRGTAYVVIEDLELGPFGNRIPQLSFEVVRAAEGRDGPEDAASLVQGVALVPGTGEYSLATTSVHFDYGGGSKDSANVNTVQARSDFTVALDDMVEELPKLGAVSLVVSWFGDDLRCGECAVRPKVEQTSFDGNRQPWSVSGLARRDALTVPYQDDRPVYGGTPSDRSVIEAIQAMNAKGLDVTFYPFILMDQMPGNGLPDPWGGDEQAVLPWRGRITTSLAPDQPGSPDGTVQADAEVAAFFGTAGAADFTIEGSGVDATVSGPGEWSFRRFILHYAALCAAAGGVEAFCIGSEMRAVTRIRGGDGSFAAVEQLRDLAAEVRKLLPDAKIGYAADWSEYGSYTPPGTADLRFPLDRLWAHDAIDFVGIDNYVPLSDWRDGGGHADEERGSIYDLDYLRSNIEGGEGYDWYYPDEAARNFQQRVPITDGAAGEPWIYRYKDLRSWWTMPHHERFDGVRANGATDWVPMSKPFRFTEFGCAAIDKGTNQPNKFLDPKSSESRLPRHSNGHRDDVVQLQYLRAMSGYYADPDNNPVSPIYGGPMLDMGHSFVWAWDARPFPAFPDLLDFWSDGSNYRRGHWLSGRSGLQPLAAVVEEICARAGLEDVDVSRVHGVVRGYSPGGVQTARAELQPLMLAHGLTVGEWNGRLRFEMKGQAAVKHVTSGHLVRQDGGSLQTQRVPEVEVPGRVLIEHVDSEGDFRLRVGEAVQPGEAIAPVSSSQLPMSLTAGEGAALAERFLGEARVGRDTAEFTLPMSVRSIRPGDLVAFDEGEDVWRVDRLEEGLGRTVHAVRAERHIFEPGEIVEESIGRSRPAAPLPADVLFMDLPLLSGDEVEHAPFLAASARPWPGGVAIYSSGEDAGYQLNHVIDSPSVIGRTETVLEPASQAVWDNGADLVVRVPLGDLRSASTRAVLGGANAMAIGSGAPDGWEIFQFRDVRMVGEDRFALSARLRGQRGTERFCKRPWPEGSTVVLLDRAPDQIDLRMDQVGLERHYRVGPATLPYDHEAYEHMALRLGGEGNRTFAPAHLRLNADEARMHLRWIRRTRIPTDAWSIGRVPLGETREEYLVEVLDAAGSVLESQQVTAATMSWSLERWRTLEVGGAARIRVAQISDVMGPGHAAVLDIGGTDR
ncbi:MAG: glycoside hydrolase/phage tail family protein [Pseudomonadota bacterium]